MKSKKSAVVALGGNAITREFEEGDIHQQFANTRKSLSGIAKMLEEGYILTISHGNGPQVGNFMIRVEATRDQLPPVPLGIMVADLCGGMGYMIAQSLQNKLRKKKIMRDVITIPAQVVVDRDDPSIHDPKKFVGSFYPAEESVLISRVRGWKMKEDRHGMWRRVVPSPAPLQIVEIDVIRRLFNAGIVVITVGGGGIPVKITDNGKLEGVDAVIDKDTSSALLATEIGAKELHILTAVEKVYLDYGRPSQRELDSLTLGQAKKYLANGQFPAGSMGAKIKAAVQFLENGGELALITSVEKHTLALKGSTGTRIIPE